MKKILKDKKSPKAKLVIHMSEDESDEVSV
jgi:hypothetical protein